MVWLVVCVGGFQVPAWGGYAKMGEEGFSQGRVGWLAAYIAAVVVVEYSKWAEGRMRSGWVGSGRGWYNTAAI